MQTFDIIDRKQRIRMTEQAGQTVKQRIAQAASDLSLAGDLAAHVVIANEAITKFAGILYQKDPDGIWANIDHRTHRFLLPCPWGEAGWKRWGLRHWEAVVLRGILMARLTDTKRPALFDYSRETRTWYLSLVDYPVIEAAQHYLQRAPISLAEWRSHNTAYRERAMTAQLRYRDTKMSLR